MCISCQSQLKEAKQETLKQQIETNSLYFFNILQRKPTVFSAICNSI